MQQLDGRLLEMIIGRMVKLYCSITLKIINCHYVSYDEKLDRVLRNTQLQL